MSLRLLPTTPPCSEMAPSFFAHAQSKSTDEEAQGIPSDSRTVTMDEKSSERARSTRSSIDKREVETEPPGDDEKHHHRSSEEDRDTMADNDDGGAQEPQATPVEDTKNELELDPRFMVGWDGPDDPKSPQVSCRPHSLFYVRSTLVPVLDD